MFNPADGTHIIKIDQSTVRKNPRAGRSDYTIPIGPPQWSKTVIETKSYMREGEASEWLLMASDTKENISVNQPIQTVFSLSKEPQWLYNYEATKVKCKECKAEFSYTELKDEFHEYIDEDGFDNYYERDKICPKCDKEDCCKYVFQSINDVIKDIPL